MSGGGYRSVPDELRGTAKSIGGAVDGVVGPHWRPPSGDYGHAGVQAGWADFIERAVLRVKELRERAEEHGRRLETTAGAYVEQEHQVSTRMRAVDGHGGIAVGAVGGIAVGSGVTGGISGGAVGSGVTGGVAGGAVGDVAGATTGAVGSGAVGASTAAEGRIGRRLGGGRR
ncbi:hypothetical protein KCV87_06820 [Actinosynnema pretiosum subsp. pretiosum]|uniref:Uncharacterized protein n=1 Tax=Actinosynnema pretiosum subsp. pretiosum TaxID=103721 RepID=A0AA45L8V8_9PSEU|nr:hypothetical protein APASM_2666 [Actinosynnema pretiosum subsp. pretiosum]QUF05789.1 hypothetical protein KCV87_06820 [Actinosynnema pretiosum subsp. pretiosum]